MVQRLNCFYGETFEDLVGFIPRRLYIGLEDAEIEQVVFGIKVEYTVFKGGVNDFPYQQYYPTNLKVRRIRVKSF